MLSNIFVTHGLSLSLRTDNGPQFTSEHLTKYLEENRIEHRRTTPLWPQAIGEIERQNRSILKRLRIAQAEGRNWKSEMDKFVMMYRRTPHSTTGVRPEELLFRRHIRTIYPISKRSASKMRFEIATVREKKKERCIQIAKGMHVKARLEKLITCYWGRRKRTNCQRHTNSLPLQLFRRLAIVFLLRLMVWSTAGK